MKKLITALITIGFVVATTAPMAAADGRRHYRGHSHRYHGHYRVYHGSGDHFWLGLGIGTLTGAFLSSFYYSPPPPRVVYSQPQTVIVRSKPIEVPPQPDYSRIAVTASELNMRSQPGLDSSVIGRVRKGDILDVIESIPDWFYVRAPDGRYGWVMDRYTRPAQPLG